MKICLNDGDAVIISENQTEAAFIAGLFEGDMSDKDRLKAFGQALINLSTQEDKTRPLPFAGVSEQEELLLPASS